MVASITRTAIVSSTANETTYTYSNVPFGEEAEDRYIIVATSGRSGSNRVVSSVTIGGVSAVIAANAPSGQNTQGVAIAFVPTGETGTVVVTHTGGLARSGIFVYRATGITGEIRDSASTIATNPSVNIDVDAGGIAVGISGVGEPNETSTWTGLTKDADESVESESSWSAAFGVFAEAQNNMMVQCSWTDNDDDSIAVASFVPAATVRIAPKMMHYRRLRI